ncbi:RraA family protein [Boseongicola aestuarii]|jgi:4-hydroxy-4-methyl-2-oxoglutarate aldolase|uniref:Putative 4-hydroxy-4-methyl-2-oxoglutarate aldolase n=1 Tax=Boseongicola aestuarii TaxID=1470561 RepID=A0A238J389_9RHOB|nr:RraA family protein [Boseongicola aestuarii]SMX24374.1 4-hydroxy-4-methyl-2-oxoglutarate aldolase [Boseongicola aestuarii]
MYEDPPLLTIKRTHRRPSDAQIKAFSGVPTAVVSDAMDGHGALLGHIRHLDAALPSSVCGPALTVWTGAADLLALHAVKRIATPGDVLVHGFDAHQGCAAFGDSLGGMMKNAGVAAIITDGPVRDVTGLIALQMPVWCTGSISSTPFENGPGTAGLPVNIGGQHVETGDMIVADRDGVVVVPFDQIDAVARRAAHIMTLEADGERAVKDGLVMPQSYEDLLDSDRVKWID